MLGRYLSVISLLLMCTHSDAQTVLLNPDKQEHLVRLVKNQMAAQNVPGLSLALIESGQVVYQNAFGQASSSAPGDAVAMLVETPTALGSLSKSFTAVAVMQLVEEGAVNLGDFISQHLHELGTPADQRILKISVRQLLNHTSGYSTYVGNFGQASYAAQGDALDVAAKRLAQVSLERDPGTGYEYSNANYQLLGLLLERLDQKSFEHSVQSRILDPLNLHNSYVRTPRRPDQIGAVGHRYWLHRPIAFTKPLPRTAVAQGGVYASASDVATYLLDLMSDQPLLLSSNARDQLFNLDEEGATKGYGLGWFIEPHASGQLIFHGGTNPGYEVEAGFLPGLGSGYVVLINANSGFAGGNVGAVILSIKQLLLEDTVIDRSSPWINRLLLAVFVLLAFSLFGCCIRWLKRLTLGSSDKAYRQFGAQRLGVGIILPGLLLLILAVTILWYIPKLSSIPLVGLQAFAPDIGLALLAAGMLSVLLAVMRTVALVRYGIQYKDEQRH